MNTNEEFLKVIAQIIMQLLFLILGIALIDFGTNHYVAGGVFCLLMYNNLRSDG